MCLRHGILESQINLVAVGMHGHKVRPPCYFLLQRGEEAHHTCVGAHHYVSTINAPPHQTTHPQLKRNGGELKCRLVRMQNRLCVSLLAPSACIEKNHVSIWVPSGRQMYKSSSLFANLSMQKSRQCKVWGPHEWLGIANVHIHVNVLQNLSNSPMATVGLKQIHTVQRCGFRIPSHITEHAMALHCPVHEAKMCRYSIGKKCVTCLTPPPDCHRVSETACVTHYWCFAILNHLRFVMPAIHSGWADNWGCARHAAHHITPFSYFNQGHPDCHEVWNARTLAGGGGGGKAGMWAEQSEDMNHQVRIQHAHSICIACTVGYHCYQQALHNLYKHRQHTNGLGAPHPPP